METENCHWRVAALDLGCINEALFENATGTAECLELCDSKVI